MAGSAAARPQPQPTEPPLSPSRSVDPSSITGRTFSGLRLPVSETPGKIEFLGARVHTWTETDRAGPGPREVSASVQRLFLTGDVRVRLGSYEFTADRAAVWAAKLDPSDPQAAPDVWQVWVYLDRAVTSATPSGISIAGDRMPIQGLIKAPQGLQLRADRVFQGRPSDPLLTTAETTLAQRLRRMVIGQDPPPQSPEDLLRQGREVPPLTPDVIVTPIPGEDPSLIAQAARRLPPAQRDAPIFPKGGEFTFISGGDIEIVSGAEENAVIFSGGITVQYWDREQDKTHQISAGRAVVFLDPGPLTREIPQLVKSPQEHVRGIYLEGDVVAQIAGDQGRYTLRAPRVFYSVRDDRALLIDAVFWTFDAKLGLPLYVRAKSISQESRNEFRATSARLSTSSFAEPDFSIGASTVTITRRETPEGDGRLWVDARDITLRGGDLPFFYWPILRGEPRDIPLRDLRFEGTTGSGGAVKTTWNAYSLLGLDAPSGNSADVLLDWYFDRGPAVGADLSWRGQGSAGGLFAYSLPSDTGTDVLPTGVKKDFDGEFRGIVMGQHRAMLDDEWTLFAEGAYISDETFVPAFFHPLARERREFTSAVYLRRLRQNTALVVLGQTNFNDFIANEYLLQSPGYTVTRYPDISYTRLADDVLSQYPGLLSYSSEFRISQMRLNFPQITPEDIGFRTGRSLAAFGIAPTVPFDDALRARGLSESPVTRFDTRHELNMPLALGPVNVTPFLVGRFTGYDEDFSDYSPDADQRYRFWGSAGVTASTEIHRIDNSVQSRFFDLHRIRHIIRPGATLWLAGSSIDRTDLPVYDDEVESLAEGTAVQLSLDQTWQTQRGGPGRWRSVDFFRLNSELVISSDDTDRRTPIGRYFEYRPELSSLGGTYGTLEAALQLTEVLGIGGHTIYDFTLSQPARTDVGLTIEQRPDLSAFIDLRYINALDQTSLIFGTSYQLTPKYSLAASANYDTNEGLLQSVATEVRRRFPAVVLGVGYAYNNISGESSLGIVFQPVGLNRPGARLLTGGSSGGLGFGG